MKFRYLFLLISFCVFNVNAGLRNYRPKLIFNSKFPIEFLAKISTEAKGLVIELGQLLQENDNSINKNMCIIMINELLGLNDEDLEVVSQNLVNSEVNYRVDKQNFDESGLFIVTKDNILHVVAQIKNALDREQKKISIDPLRWYDPLGKI
ncbi:MAG: hypothetical protein SZ59_C0002G0179 [candidate division TM6 bacterium GW2011_GWF2_28_16]|nr:MAG: hypothetical protein SZ59_C0002G0179 [candidate division TM6 bacterium GW2011_GWF2_28_16]